MVANMTADMEVDMEVELVSNVEVDMDADMEVDMVADMVAYRGPPNSNQWPTMSIKVWRFYKKKIGGITHLM